jgi:KinB signaling pathway activation protein
MFAGEYDRMSLAFCETGWYNGKCERSREHRLKTRFLAGKRRLLQLTIRKWFHLFWTTLLWGSGAAIAAGMILLLLDYDIALTGVSQFGYNAITMLLAGATVSVVCQMGFFAYLILRSIVIGMIRNKRIADLVQWFLIIVTLYELASLRYLNFADEGTPFIRYFDLPLIVLLLSLGIAYWKTKLTHFAAFVPTLFFMVVATTLEAVPALKLNNWPSTLFMLAPLFCCNAWQILILHKLVDEPDSRHPNVKRGV